ncbi:MlaC/ttg2D family ABC transporter substrate-binding protein [Basilea psittacipulmonis]|uniref:ABC transporter n=1 Tax=Basilea psittacipulmonis DSM 24701 TaxID=1072685 RepID=A0A077DIP1_9BURK|nr:ABC transporter substrate-binding protein [Basilea psittacipulmonis]AIL33327.1 ABC transporter [Basilea psittacipulmonis DSM 24701]
MKLLKTFLTMCCLCIASQAWSLPNPNDFIEKIANQTLKAILENDSAHAGNIEGIQEVVNQYVMPYVDMNRATRLAVGAPWRQATDAQKKALVDGFSMTLMQTYSGAFKAVDKDTKITMLPFRGDPKAKDVVVSSVLENLTNRIRVDYRMIQTNDSWLVYDLAVEGIWLIQNYRNQFAGEISRHGIDGLVEALSKKKQ